MLSWGEQVKQYVMLWADTHDFSSLIHIVEQIFSKKTCFSLRAAEEASQHRDSRRLASTIVSKKTEDLVSIHLEIHSINSFEAIFVLFIQIGDFEQLFFNFSLVHICTQLFIAVWIEELGFKSEGLVNRVALDALITNHRSSINVSDLTNLDTALVSASPEGAREAEAEASSSSKCLGHHLFKIKAKDGNPNHIYSHHNHAMAYSEVVELGEEI